MKRMVVRFLREEEGQDLIEYTLLLGFVALASAALFIGAGNAAISIWGVANSDMASAASAAAAAS
jgi:Flp pilus assembly pilin Flp